MVSAVSAEKRPALIMKLLKGNTRAGSITKHGASRVDIQSVREEIINFHFFFCLFCFLTAFMLALCLSCCIIKQLNEIKTLIKKFLGLTNK